MKLSWTEPWSRERVRHRIREANKSMPSARKISIWGGVLSFGAMLCVRWTLPESGKEFERTAVGSTRVPDSEVEKFLFDVGLAHLWKGETKKYLKMLSPN